MYVHIYKYIEKNRSATITKTLKFISASKHSSNTKMLDDATVCEFFKGLLSVITQAKLIIDTPLQRNGGLPRIHFSYQTQMRHEDAGLKPLCSRLLVF